MTTRLASQARRWDVPAGTRTPSSKTDWPGASASARTSASTWTTTWKRSPGSARIELVTQGRLSDELQRIGLLLLHRGWIAHRCLAAPARIQSFPSGRQRLHEQSAHFGREPTADPHRTVFIRIHVQ